MFLALCPETPDDPLQTLAAQASAVVSVKGWFGGQVIWFPNKLKNLSRNRWPL